MGDAQAATDACAAQTLAVAPVEREPLLGAKVLSSPEEVHAEDEAACGDRGGTAVHEPGDPSTPPAEACGVTRAAAETCEVQADVVDTQPADVVRWSGMSWHEAAASDELGALEHKFKLNPELLASVDNRRSTALHHAARDGACHAAQWLLAHNVDPDPRDRQKATPLHLAASCGHLETSRLFLVGDAGKSCVPATDQWRRTPLHHAAVGGHDDVVAALIGAKANAAKGDVAGDTPLHLAAGSGHVKVSQLLPVLDVPNNEGYSPLDLCVQHRHKELGDSLVVMGAKLHTDRKTPLSLVRAVQQDLPFLCTYVFKTSKSATPLHELDGEGRSATTLAAHMGFRDVMKRLLEGRADVELASHGRRPIHEAAGAGHAETVALLVEMQAGLHATDVSGQTCLFHAARQGHASVCAQLQGLGVRAETRDDQERTALHAAAVGGSVTVSEVLMGGDLVTLEDWQGFQAVHLAIQEGHVEMCRHLVSASANLQAPLEFGLSPLLLATDRGHADVVRFLLTEADTAVDEAGCDGRTALLLAAAGGHLPCCRHLMAHGAALSAVDRHGRDALSLASRSGHVQMCELLWEHGATFTLDLCGWTPLHVASAEGHVPVVTWLLGVRADLSSLDVDGKTPLQSATTRGQGGVEAALRAHARLLSTVEPEHDA